MRFSTRERLRPTSCAFSGSFQKPGADISRSISSSDFLAEARSKIAPDRGETVFERGDSLKSFVFHLFLECRMQNAECRIAPLLILHSAFCIFRGRIKAIITSATAPHANQSPYLTYAVVVTRGSNRAYIVPCRF